MKAGLGKPKNRTLLSEEMTPGVSGPSALGSGASEFANFATGHLIAQKYRVERTLGAGAMGVVVAARHLVLDEAVAIKFIHPDMRADRSVVQRFAREAKACVRIKSDHVVKVLDVGVSDALGPFIVMEYLEGRTLAEALTAEGAFAVPRACEFVLQACEALALAHSMQIAHRDIKPGNLFLTRRGDLEIVKLLDFGISKANLTGHLFGGELSLVETTYMLGTPLYMSPEQIRAAPDIDHRTDIWSMGVVLRELISGKSAFVAESLTQVCAKVLECQPLPLVRQGTVVPAKLEAVIDRCLAKRPQDRFQSVADLAAALVPFAPARARLHADRARSVAPHQEAMPPNLQASGLFPPSSSPARRAGEERQMDGSGVPSVRTRRRRVRFVLGALGLVVVGLLGWGWLSTPAEVELARGSDGALDGSGEPGVASEAPDPSVAQGAALRLSRGPNPGRETSERGGVSVVPQGFATREVRANEARANEDRANEARANEARANEARANEDRANEARANDARKDEALPQEARRSAAGKRVSPSTRGGGHRSPPKEAPPEEVESSSRVTGELPAPDQNAPSPAGGGPSGSEPVRPEPPDGTRTGSGGARPRVSIVGHGERVRLVE